MRERVRRRTAAPGGSTRQAARLGARTNRASTSPGGDLTAQRDVLDHADRRTSERLLTDLQQTHGNAYVNGLLAGPVAQRDLLTAPRTAAGSTGVEWAATVQPGGEAREGRHGPREGATSAAGGTWRLYKGDTLVVIAKGDSGHIGSTAQSEHFYSGQKTSTESVAGTAEQGQVAWSIRLEHVGDYQVNFGSGHSEHITVVHDLPDFQASVVDAVTLLRARYGALHAKLEAAGEAYSIAFRDQEADLKELGRDERLVGDMLLGALFAGLGGIGGGIVGAGMGMVVKRWALNAFAGAAITDGAKDLGKFIVRSAPRVAGNSGSAPNVTGDATATVVGSNPASGGEGRESGAGRQPLEWLTGWLSRLDAEESQLTGGLNSVISGSRSARDFQGKIDYAEDPAELLRLDHELADEAISQINTDPKVFLKELWHTWLANYAWKVGSAPEWSTDRYAPESAMTRKATQKVDRVAQKCGESLAEWRKLVQQWEGESQAAATAESAKRNADEGPKVPNLGTYD